MTHKEKQLLVPPRPSDRKGTFNETWHKPARVRCFQNIPPLAEKRKVCEVPSSVLNPIISGLPPPESPSVCCSIRNIKVIIGLLFKSEVFLCNPTIFHVEVIKHLKSVWRVLNPTCPIDCKSNRNWKDECGGRTLRNKAASSQLVSAWVAHARSFQNLPQIVVQLIWGQPWPLRASKKILQTQPRCPSKEKSTAWWGETMVSPTGTGYTIVGTNWKHRESPFKDSGEFEMMTGKH